MCFKTTNCRSKILWNGPGQMELVLRGCSIKKPENTVVSGMYIELLKYKGIINLAQSFRMSLRKRRRRK